MKETIAVRITRGEKEKIESVIKQEYPKLRTISAVVRLALNKFLADY